MSWIYDLNPLLIFEYSPVSTLSIVSFMAVVYTSSALTAAAFMLSISDYTNRILQYYREHDIGDIARLRHAANLPDPDSVVRRLVWVNVLKLPALPASFPDTVQNLFTAMVRCPLLFKLLCEFVGVTLFFLVIACMEENLKIRMFSSDPANTTALTIFRNIPILLILASIAATKVLADTAIKATLHVEAVFEILNYYQFVANSEITTKLAARKKPSKKNIAEAYNAFLGMHCLNKSSDSRPRLMRETK